MSGESLSNRGEVDIDPLHCDSHNEPPTVTLDLLSKLTMLAMMMKCEEGRRREKGGWSKR